MRPSVTRWTAGIKTPIPLSPDRFVKRLCPKAIRVADSAAVGFVDLVAVGAGAARAPIQRKARPAGLAA